MIVQSLSCLTLCDPMDCSTPGFSVLYYLPEFAQTQVQWVGDAIQPSHPLSSWYGKLRISKKRLLPVNSVNRTPLLLSDSSLSSFLRYFTAFGSCRAPIAMRVILVFGWANKLHPRQFNWLPSPSVEEAKFRLFLNSFQHFSSINVSILWFLLWTGCNFCPTPLLIFS